MFAANGSSKMGLLGGEAAMWSEYVDQISFSSVVYPRAAAAAEVLWSSSYKATKLNATDTLRIGKRLAEHRCRLLRRGVTSGPLNDMTFARDFNAGCM